MTKPPSTFPPGLSQKLKQHTVRSSTPKGQQGKLTILLRTTKRSSESFTSRPQVPVRTRSQPLKNHPHVLQPQVNAKQSHVTPFCSFLGWISSLTCTGSSPSVTSSCTPGTSTTPAILSHSTPMGLVPCQPSAPAACCTTQGCHQTRLQLLLAQVPGELNTLLGNCSLVSWSEAILPCRNKDVFPLDTALVACVSKHKHT